MDNFEEYFRTTKHYENMLLEIARNQLSVSVFDKNGRKYGNHIVQTAYEVFQHQQAKVEELQTLYAQQGINMLKLQKRVDAALKKLDKRRDELWSKWKEQADMQDQGAANAFEEAYWILEQALKGEG
ncbi:hypothetical protein Q5M62_13375 [Acinetobacter baumannii]|nr:hypothetical protein [Acinetobacter baumannii]